MILSNWICHINKEFSKRHNTHQKESRMLIKTLRDRFKKKCKHITPIAQSNTQLVCKIGQIYFSMDKWLLALETFQKLFTTPFIRHLRPFLYERTGLCFLHLKQFGMANICFINGCLATNLLHVQSSVFFQTCVAKFFFYISLTFFLCGNFEKALNYIEMLLQTLSFLGN